jgi:hypothetical protein
MDFLTSLDGRSNGRMAVKWTNTLENSLISVTANTKITPDNTRSKAVIDLVLQAYLPKDTKIEPDKLDPEFRAFSIRQIRLFVFVGHDSISSKICYCFHLLSKNLDALARIRAEHDSVFRTNISTYSTATLHGFPSVHYCRSQRCSAIIFPS